MAAAEPSMVRSPVATGDVVDRKYKVDGVLGAGGMGVVVAATHLALDEPVALKFMTLGDGRGDATSRARFLREAKAARKLTSAHVARVFDVGQLPTGEPYIVMELLRGNDLAKHLRLHGRLSPGDTVAYMLQVCDAIREAHALGIIHRDLKPQNLFLAERAGNVPILKVLDFGIAKSLETTAPDGSLTASQGVVGSPVYMSPEQLRASKHVDLRTDVWSMGVIMFELLSGKVPFVGDSVMELGMRIMTVPAPSLVELREELPAGLADVVQRCLQKEPEQRFATIEELARALKAYADVSQRSLPYADTMGDPVSVAPETNDVRTGGEFAQTNGGPSSAGVRTKWTWAGLGAAALALSALAIVHQVDPAKGPPKATAPARASVFHVDLRVTPPGARIRYDDEAPTRTPFARDVTLDGRAHSIRVEADGFEPMSLSFRDAPPPSDIALTPLPAPVAPPSSQPSAEAPPPVPVRHTAPHASSVPSAPASPAPSTPVAPRTTTNDAPIIR